MKKFTTILFLITTQVISLHGHDDCSNDDHNRSECLIEKGQTVVVTTADELTNAIQAAAADLNRGTKIVIEGNILGNFEIPFTYHLVKLVGSGNGATLNGNSAGTTLIVDLGANVKLENLTITGGSNTDGTGLVAAGYGIINQGKLAISKCSISNNPGGGGVMSWGDLTMEDSTLTGNVGQAVYNNSGTMTVKNSIISQNLEHGVLNQLGKLDLINCAINNNVYSGVYNYYAAITTIKNCTVNNNAYYGIYNTYASIVNLKYCDVNGNTYGGIYSTGTTVDIYDCSINDNVGSGIFNYEYSTLTVHKTSINGNTSGGIYNYYSPVNLSKCTLSGNSNGNAGGAISNNDEGIVSICHCKLVNNSSTQNGGGIYNAYLLTVDHSIIENNTASGGGGGGIYNDSFLFAEVEFSTLVVKHSHIKGNTSTGDGGGIYNIAIANIDKTKIKNNTAVYGGGIANEDSGSITVAKSKVSYNTATYGVGGGGGIYTPSSSFLIEKSLVVDNTPDQIVQ